MITMPLWLTLGITAAHTARTLLAPHRLFAHWAWARTLAGLR
jgi:hypothetical protein